MYAGRDFSDGVSGLRLDQRLSVRVRKDEIEFFKARGVCTEVRRQPWMKVITCDWIDYDK